MHLEITWEGGGIQLTKGLEAMVRNLDLNKRYNMILSLKNLPFCRRNFEQGKQFILDCLLGLKAPCPRKSVRTEKTGKTGHGKYIVGVNLGSHSDLALFCLRPFLPDRSLLRLLPLSGP